MNPAEIDKGLETIAESMRLEELSDDEVLDLLPKIVNYRSHVGVDAFKYFCGLWKAIDREDFEQAAIIRQKLLEL